MGNSVQRSARAAIAAIQVALAELLAAAGEAGSALGVAAPDAARAGPTGGARLPGLQVEFEHGEDLQRDRSVVARVRGAAASVFRGHRAEQRVQKENCARHGPAAADAGRNAAPVVTGKTRACSCDQFGNLFDRFRINAGLARREIKSVLGVELF